MRGLAFSLVLICAACEPDLVIRKDHLTRSNAGYGAKITVQGKHMQNADAILIGYAQQERLGCTIDQHKVTQAEEQHEVMDKKDDKGEPVVKEVTVIQGWWTCKRDMPTM